MVVRHAVVGEGAARDVVARVAGGGIAVAGLPRGARNRQPLALRRRELGLAIEGMATRTDARALRKNSAGTQSTQDNRAERASDATNSNDGNLARRGQSSGQISVAAGMQSVIGKTFERRAPQRAWNFECSQGRDQQLAIRDRLAQHEGAGDRVSCRSSGLQTFSGGVWRIC